MPAKPDLSPTRVSSVLCEIARVASVCLVLVLDLSVQAAAAVAVSHVALPV